MTGVLTDNHMEMEGNIEQQRLEDLLGQEAVKMGQTILLIQVPSAEGSGHTQVKTIEVDHQ